MSFASGLYHARKKSGLSQEDVAGKLGVSRQTISKWETGTSYPDITLLCPLARALGTSVDALLQFEETLSDEEVVRQVNQLLETAMRQQPDGWQAAERQLEELLQTPPTGRLPPSGWRCWSSRTATRKPARRCCASCPSGWATPQGPGPSIT